MSKTATQIAARLRKSNMNELADKIDAANAASEKVNARPGTDSATAQAKAISRRYLALVTAQGRAALAK